MLEITTLQNVHRRAMLLDYNSMDYKVFCFIFWRFHGCYIPGKVSLVEFSRTLVKPALLQNGPECYSAYMAIILTFKTVHTQLESIFLRFCESRDGSGGQSAIFTS